MRTKEIFDILYDSVEPVSGECIAERLGITRIAVNKHIKKLQDTGIAIETSRKGYRYIQSDSLTTYTLGARLAERGMDIPVYIECVDSTNSAVKQLVSEGVSGDFIFVAPSQTAGRGRAGRRFLSGEGGVYMTLCYCPYNLSVTDSLNIVLLTGLCVLRVLSRYVDDVTIKWPNDVFIQDKKAVGILLESVVSEYTVDKLVLGIGINVSNYISDDIRDIAVSLKDCGVSVDREQIIAEVVEEIYREFKVYQQSGFAPFIGEYVAKSRTIGHSVTVSNGADKKCGNAVGLSDEGYLLLDIDGKIEKIIVGDVVSNI